MCYLRELIKSTALLAIVFIMGCSEKVNLSDYPKGFENACKPIVAVYPVWKHADNALNELPWGRFTHIAVAAVYPESTGNLASSGADVFIDKLVALAHAKGKKVIVSIGGAGEASKGFVELFKNGDRSDILIENIIAYVRKHNLDGIDIDWEFWTYQSIKNKGGNDPVESQQLVLLLKKLKEKIAPNLLLTADIAVGPWVGEQYLPQIQEYADYVNLMAFDFTGAWPESAIDYHSNFKEFKQAVKLTLNKGFKGYKVLAGIPAYGIEFKDGKNESIVHHAYSDIVNMLDENELEKESVGNVYFETPKSITRKSEYIKSNYLGGAFLFEITSDHKEKKHSLLSPVSTILNPAHCYL